MRHLQKKTQVERQVFFETILAGIPGHRNLLEAFLNSIKEDKDRNETLGTSARMICRAIEVCKLERELGYYLYDCAACCRHPAIGFKPKQ